MCGDEREDNDRLWLGIHFSSQNCSLFYELLPMKSCEEIPYGFMAASQPEGLVTGLIGQGTDCCSPVSLPLGFTSNFSHSSGEVWVTFDLLHSPQMGTLLSALGLLDTTGAGGNSLSPHACIAPIMECTVLQTAVNQQG